MEHQNWTTTIISNPNLIKQKQQNGPKKIVERTGDKQSFVKTDAEGEVIGVKKVSSQMAHELVNARVAKKLTQVQLAKLCNTDPKTISENEKGGNVYNAQIWNKLCKELGVKIERNTV